MKLVIPGPPRTKKNSQRICINRKTRRRFVKPSEAYESYLGDAGVFIPEIERKAISTPVNVKCVYFMQTRRKVDLVNLLEATLDVLVHYRVIADDNSSIVVGHDGSRVGYDKHNPRVEIEIEEIRDGL